MRRASQHTLAVLAVMALVAAGCGGGRGGGADAASASADPGITDTSIKLGGSYPLSGPASAYAPIAEAVQAYFRYVNEELGGVEMGDGKTRKIEFVFYDDGYAPPRMVENARRLIEQDKVFALFNTLGTPTNSAIVDYVNEQEVPHLFLSTGASKWGADPERYPWTIGWQPAYASESGIYAEYLRRVDPDAKVAVLYQNDDYGADYLEGFEAAIEGTDIEIVARESYQVSDPSVASQVVNLSRSNADVFLDLTTPKFAAQAIERLASTGWEPLHLLNSVSASIESTFKPAGIENAAGIMTVTYIKDAADPRWDDDPAMQFYKEKGAEYGDFNLVDPLGVFAFAVAESLVKVLERMEEPTREAMMDAARHLDGVEIGLLLPGIELRTDGADDGFPIEEMQLIRFDGQAYEPVGELISYEGKTPVPGRG